MSAFTSSSRAALIDSSNAFTAVSFVSAVAVSVACVAKVGFGFGVRTLPVMPVLMSLDSCILGAGFSLLNPNAIFAIVVFSGLVRSEERRVGKERRFQRGE